MPGMETEITVVDGVDGFTPDMLRVRKDDKRYLEYQCLLCNAREYVWTDTGLQEVIDRHAHGLEGEYEFKILPSQVS